MAIYYLVSLTRSLKDANDDLKAQLLYVSTTFLWLAPYMHKTLWNQLELKSRLSKVKRKHVTNTPLVYRKEQKKNERFMKWLMVSKLKKFE